MSDAALEARIKRLEDRQEIEDLITRYEFVADDYDFEGRADFFTKDGGFRHEDGSINVRGRENLLAEVLELRQKLGYGKAEPAIHYHHAHLIEFTDEDTATGRVTAHVERATPSGTVVTAMRFYDTYRREEGRWRIHDRLVRFWYRMKLTDLSTHFIGPDTKMVPAPAKRADLPYVLESYKKAMEPSSRK